MDTDALLAAMNGDLETWDNAPRGSRYEWEAAERLTSGFAALDDYIRHGGKLPKAWQGTCSVPATEELSAALTRIQERPVLLTPGVPEVNSIAARIAEELQAARPPGMPPHHAAARELLTLIRDNIEDSDGSWNGGDVVDFLTGWISSQGVPVEDPDDAQRSEQT